MSYLVDYEGQDITPTDEALTAIRARRALQDAKWGVQHHKPGMWRLILDEELGEVARAVLEDDGNLRSELVDAAAVLVAWIECLDTERPGAGE